MPLNADNIEMMLGIDASSIHVIADNGAPVDDAMVAWAQDLQPGTWYTLDHNGASAQVQYAWQSQRKQLHLLCSGGWQQLPDPVAPPGRAYLQAGLLVAQDEEGLFVRATRDALGQSWMPTRNDCGLMSPAGRCLEPADGLASGIAWERNRDVRSASFAPVWLPVIPGRSVSPGRPAGTSRRATVQCDRRAPVPAGPPATSMRPCPCGRSEHPAPWGHSPRRPARGLLSHPMRPPRAFTPSWGRPGTVVAGILSSSSILGRLHQLGALTDQRMTTARLWRVDGAWDGKHFTTLFGGHAGGDQEPDARAASTTSVPCEGGPK